MVTRPLPVATLHFSLEYSRPAPRLPLGVYFDHPGKRESGAYWGPWFHPPRQARERRLLGTPVVPPKLGAVLRNQIYGKEL